MADIENNSEIGLATNTLLCEILERLSVQEATQSMTLQILAGISAQVERLDAKVSTSMQQKG